MSAAVSHAHAPQAHSSTAAHLATETALLKTLYVRSKDQHRGQVWLPRLAGVLRLGKILQHEFSDLRTRRREAAEATPGPAQYGKQDERLVQLVRRLCTSLISAAGWSLQVLALHHFMPLHVLLLASYARLLAVTMALGTTLGAQVDDLVTGRGEELVKIARSLPKASASKTDIMIPTEKSDVGERIERPVKKIKAEIAQKASSSREPSVAEPGSADVGEQLTAAATATKSKKKRKSDVLDSIFAPAAIPSDGERSVLSSPEPTKGKVKSKKRRAPSPDVMSSKPVNTGSSVNTSDSDHKTETPKKLKKKDKGIKDESKPPSTGDISRKSKPKTKSKKKRDDMDSIFGF